MRKLKNCIYCGKFQTRQVCEECSILVTQCPFFKKKSEKGIQCRRGGVIGVASPIYLDIATNVHHKNYCCNKYTSCPNHHKLMDVKE